MRKTHFGIIIAIGYIRVSLTNKNKKDMRLYTAKKNQIEWAEIMWY